MVLKSIGGPFMILGQLIQHVKSLKMKNCSNLGLDFTYDHSGVKEASSSLFAELYTAIHGDQGSGNLIRFFHMTCPLTVI